MFYNYFVQVDLFIYLFQTYKEERVNQKKQSYNKNEDHTKGNKVVDRSFVCAFFCDTCLPEKKTMGMVAVINMSI